MAENKKSSSFDLALILGVGNTAAIICSFVYMYRTMTAMQAQLTRLSDVMSSTILTVNEMKGESPKSKEFEQILANLGSEVGEISADLQQIAVNDNSQLIKAQMFAIMDALKESGIEPEVLMQRYPQQFQFQNGFNPMQGMMPGMPQQGMHPGMMNGMHQGMHPGMDIQQPMHNHNMSHNGQQQQQPMHNHNMSHNVQQPMNGHNPHFYNPNMQPGQNTAYMNLNMQQPHVSPLGRTVSGTNIPNRTNTNVPQAGRGRGRGRPVAQAPVNEEEPAPADIDREAVLRQMSSGSGRGHR